MNRRGFIGGSDIPVIIGVSPWKDRLRLFAEKTGAIEPDQRESKVKRRGKILEAPIVELYREEVGEVAISSGGVFRLDGEPHFCAQVDAIESADGYDIPLEIKSASEFTRGKWGPSGTDDAPTAYCAQLHWQLAVTGAPRGKIVALLGADDLRVYPIDRDEKIVEFLLEKAREFWTMIQTNTAPDIDFDHPTAGDTLAALFRNFKATEILQADDALRAWRDVMVDATALETRYRVTKENARNHLLEAMRNAAVIDFGDGQMYERKVVKRAGYTVGPTEHVDARLKKTKADAAALALPERIGNVERSA